MRLLNPAALMSAASVFGLSLSLSANDNMSWVYFGTYTSPATGSQGIYRSAFDVTSGDLGEPVIAAVTLNPNFLAISPAHDALYCAGRPDATGADGDAISAYHLDRATGNLTFINEVSSVGRGPCHLNTDRTGRLLAIANYVSGSCASFAVQSDGALSPAVSVFQPTGHGADPDRQSGPHAHSVNFSPDNRFAYVCDLGLDQVLIYAVEPTSGQLTANTPAFVRLPPASGPRHLAFHPTANFVFVNNELANTVTVFARDPASGVLSILASTSSLPEAARDQPGHKSAETVVHPNGRFVYVSNRGHDTIAVFRFDAATAQLTLLANVPCEGHEPRNFSLDPSGHWMLVANQYTNSVAVFAVDPESGLLTFTGQRRTVGAPVCVRFVPRD